MLEFMNYIFYRIYTHALKNERDTIMIHSVGIVALFTFINFLSIIFIIDVIFKNIFSEILILFSKKEYAIALSIFWFFIIYLLFYREHRRKKIVLHFENITHVKEMHLKIIYRIYIIITIMTPVIFSYLLWQ